MWTKGSPQAAGRHEALYKRQHEVLKMGRNTLGTEGRENSTRKGSEMRPMWRVWRTINKQIIMARAQITKT